MPINPITITELKTKEDLSFLVELRFSERHHFQIHFPAFHDSETDKQLEWYFEQYILEPYTAQAFVDKRATRLETYGIQLFEILFQDTAALRLYKDALEAHGFENLVFDVYSQTTSTGFQAIIWEALRDPDFADEPLIVKGAGIYRRTKKKAALSARANPSSSINLLVVTARPSEENDANYRTIQRPLIDIIRRNPLVRITPYILRPGTNKALRQHLARVKAGFYHIIHFDLHGEVLTFEDMASKRKAGKVRFAPQETFGKHSQTFNVRYGVKDLKPYKGKRAFLFFESEQKGEAIPVSATEIARLMRDYRVPVCILNACQSAKQSDASSETSLAKFLQDHGVDLVLAMRYTVSVSAASILMKHLYTELLSGHSLDKAIYIARKELFNTKIRKATLSYEIDLEDWALPVIYKRKDIRFDLSEESKEEKQIRFERQEKLNVLPDMIGRDLDILKIEKLLLPPNNHLLIRGMVGVGKTTLLQYLSAWWVLTNFRAIKAAVYFDCEAQSKYDFKFFLKFVAKKILPKDRIGLLKHEIIDYTFVSGEVLDTLNHNPHVIILDNVFELVDEQLIRFLSRIDGPSFVVFGSVNPEQSLQAMTFKRNIYLLEGLNKDDAYVLADEIIQQYTSTTLAHFLDNEPQATQQLLKILAGIPWVMQQILPQLKQHSATELLENYRKGSWQLV